MEHQEELKSRHEKLVTIAEHYGIDPERYAETQAEHDSLTKEMSVLDKQKRIVKSAIDTTTRKYEQMLNEKKKEFD
jgi:SMC interacting uncharacterized protein involved in chromosome segregation